VKRAFNDEVDGSNPSSPTIKKFYRSPRQKVARFTEAASQARPFCAFASQFYWLAARFLNL